MLKQYDKEKSFSVSEAVDFVRSCLRSTGSVVESANIEAKYNEIGKGQAVFNTEMLQNLVM